VQPDSHKDENLLATLRQYYKEIKMKHQLNLELPTGFCQENDLQRTLRDAKLYHLSSPTLDDLSHLDTSPDLSNLDILPYNSSSTSISSSDTTVITDNTSIKRVPILQCIDKPSSYLPSRLMLSEDFICATVGFCRVSTRKRNLSVLYQDTISIDQSPCDAILDSGDLATLRKTPRNITPVPRPNSFG